MAAVGLILVSCSGKDSPTGLGGTGLPTSDSTAAYVDAAADSSVADGSPEHPFTRIQTAIDSVAARGRGEVLVASGNYPGSIRLRAKVNVGGGYIPGLWTRAGGAPSVIQGDSVGVRVVGADSVTLEHFTIQSADAVRPGGSSIGVLVASSHAVVIANNRIMVGAGARGGRGRDGRWFNALSYNQAQPGQSASLCPPFPQGGRYSDKTDGNAFTFTRGGSGGDGGGAIAGDDGEPGAGAGGGTGGAGGGGGEDGGRGGDGRPGTDGADGASGAAWGGVSVAGYLGADGGWGGNGGFGGSGGGGGGGGGAILCGGGGGGGGSGGDPFLGGAGGQGGGGSIGLVLIGGTGVIITDNEITTSDGGAGGSGGNGGGGEPYTADDPFMNGKDGGPATTGAHKGGRGGNGGPGGDGGHGAGGGGGPTIGIVHLDSVPTMTGNSFTIGTAGAGGASAANAGVAGLSAQTLDAGNPPPGVRVSRLAHRPSARTTSHARR